MKRPPGPTPTLTRYRKISLPPGFFPCYTRVSFVHPSFEAFATLSRWGRAPATAAAPQPAQPPSGPDPPPPSSTNTPPHNTAICWLQPHQPCPWGAGHRMSSPHKAGTCSTRRHMYIEWDRMHACCRSGSLSKHIEHAPPHCCPLQVVGPAKQELRGRLQRPGQPRVVPRWGAIDVDLEPVAKSTWVPAYLVSLLFRVLGFRVLGFNL